MKTQSRPTAALIFALVTLIFTNLLTGAFQYENGRKAGGSACWEEQQRRQDEEEKRIMLEHKARVFVLDSIKRSKNIF